MLIGIDGDITPIDIISSYSWIFRLDIDQSGGELEL